MFSNETSSEVILHGTIYWVCSSSKLKSVDEILWCYHLNETSSAVLLHGTIYYVVLVNWNLCMRSYGVTILMQPLW